MAVSLLGQEVSDLCIGKPPLRSLPPSAATVAFALAALKHGSDPHLAILDKRAGSLGSVAVVGRLSAADVVCYLCSEENLRAPADALARPVSALVPRDSGLVRRVEPNFSLLEALDVILEGAKALVVPLRSGGRRKLAGGAISGELCWLTQEDFIRYFLNSIALFSHVATQSIQALGLVRPAGDLAVRHFDPAHSALPIIRSSIADQTAVAVVGDDGKLYGEISPLALASADAEAMAAAIAALSAGDLMAYIDYFGFPPEGLVRAVKAGLKERNLNAMLELMEENCFSSSTTSSSASSSSSDEESGPGSRRSRLRARSRSFSIGRRAEEPAVCYPGSSLVAVMAQALAQGVSYLWVVDEADCRLVGIVSFVDVLRVLREQL